MSHNGRLHPDPLVHNRALAAWLLSARAGTGRVSDRQRPGAFLCQHHSDRYVVITGTSAGVLAVYRIDADGTLMRLDRWPGEIESYLSPGSRRSGGQYPGTHCRSSAGACSQCAPLPPVLTQQPADTDAWAGAVIIGFTRGKSPPSRAGTGSGP